MAQSQLMHSPSTTTSCSQTKMFFFGTSVRVEVTPQPCHVLLAIQLLHLVVYPSLVSPVVKIFLKLINGNNMFVLEIKQKKQKDTCAKKKNNEQNATQRTCFQFIYPSHTQGLNQLRGSHSNHRVQLTCLEWGGVLKYHGCCIFWTS